MKTPLTLRTLGPRPNMGIDTRGAIPKIRAIMALIEIQRRCDECEKTRALVENLRSEHQRAILDYQNLYEKVRTNLGKLAKRARIEETPEPVEDPIVAARRMLVERKLGRRQNGIRS